MAKPRGQRVVAVHRLRDCLDKTNFDFLLRDKWWASGTQIKENISKTSQKRKKKNNVEKDKPEKKEIKQKFLHTKAQILNRKLSKWTADDDQWMDINSAKK